MSSGQIKLGKKARKQLKAAGLVPDSNGLVIIGDLTLVATSKLARKAIKVKAKARKLTKQAAKITRMADTLSAMAFKGRGISHGIEVETYGIADSLYGLADSWLHEGATRLNGQH